VRVFNGICSLVEIPHPYEEWRRIHSWEYGDIVYGLDVSPDGQQLSASVGEINGQQSLRVTWPQSPSWASRSSKSTRA
jgi:hypothetical protein